ncbi:MAG: small subunit ribosomal protein S9 [Parcubacteria group bacterium LiPW_30]|nr:MAG: small subunit ribosomal protein S9 [Parcubacteria group bacterium LiPW_30]
METTTKTKKEGRYIETVGRRKTSSARVRVTPGAKLNVIVNEKDYKEYFPTEEMQGIITDAFNKAKPLEKYSVTALVKGGGIHSQAEAVRHGIARALSTTDEELKTRLKRLGYLKRDPRMKERRKFGLKKARKAPQWSKR